MLFKSKTGSGRSILAYQEKKFSPDDGEDENENVRDLAEVVIKKLGGRRKEG